MLTTSTLGVCGGGGGGAGRLNEISDAIDGNRGAMAGVAASELAVNALRQASVAKAGDKMTGPLQTPAVWGDYPGSSGFRTVQTVLNPITVSVNQQLTSTTYYALKVPAYRYLLQLQVVVGNNRSATLLVLNGFATTDSWAAGRSAATSTDSRIINEVLFASKDNAPYILFKGAGSVNFGTASVMSAVGSVATPAYSLDITDGWALSLENDVSAFTVVESPALNVGLQATGPGTAAAGAFVADTGALSSAFGDPVITKLDTGVYEFRRANGASVTGRFSVIPENGFKVFCIQYQNGAAQIRLANLSGAAEDGPFRFLFFPNP